MRKLFFCLLVIGTGAFVLWLAFGFCWQLLQSRLVKVDLLRSGRFTQTVLVQGWLLKKETLVKSGTRGQLRLLVKDGERVRAGSAVAEVITVEYKNGLREEGVFLIRAPQAGIVCTHIDGLETTLKPDMALEMVKMEKLVPKSMVSETGMRVEKGQPVAKVIDNLVPIRVWLKLSQKELPEIVKGVVLDILWGEDRLKASVEDVQLIQGYYNVFFDLPVYPDKLVHYRQVEIKVVKKEVVGFFIPRKALVEKNGLAGIYLLDNNRYVKWFPVMILDTKGDHLVISKNGLAEEALLIVNPRWVQEGDEIRLRL